MVSKDVNMTYIHYIHTCLARVMHTHTIDELVMQSLLIGSKICKHNIYTYTYCIYT